MIESFFKKKALYFTFYKSFCFVSIVISLVCGYDLFKSGPAEYAMLFWFKVITSGLIFYYMKEYKTKEFYFYKNLGVSKKALWIFSASIDFLIYFAFVLIALKLYGKLA